MENYKTPDGALQRLESDAFTHLLPPGCVKISQEEADDLLSQTLAPTIPTSLTMRQARLALLAAGHLDTVLAMVSAMSRADQISWEFASIVERSDPMTATLAEALGLDGAALDALFAAGAQL